jgi:hypothetical protein
MRTAIKLFALLAIILSFAACKTDDPFTPGDDNLGIANKANSNISFTAEVDGAVWEAAEITAVQSDGGSGSNPNIDVRQFTIKGENADGDVIQFVLQRATDEAFGIGVYNLDEIPTGADSYSIVFLHTGPNGSFQSFPSKSSAIIEITKIAGTQIEGTFNATLHQGSAGDSVVIEGGVFMSDKYGTFY